MTEMSTPVAALVTFARSLREAGVAVGSRQVVTFCEAVAQLGPQNLGDLYWAGRSCLVSRHKDVAIYDVLFHRHFGGVLESGALDGEEHGDSDERQDLDLVEKITHEGEQDQHAEENESQGVDLVEKVIHEGEHDGIKDMVGTVASSLERLRFKRFPELTADEMLTIHRLMESYRFNPPLRRSRRMQRAPRGHQTDMRRTLRAAVRFQGEIAERAWRRRRKKRRRIVMLLDVSGSMAEYSRPLLVFANAVARGSNDVEVFCFGTRLTRVTDVLRCHDPDIALERATQRVADWDGGTRIGHALDMFLSHWGSAGLVRGAVLVICSDGLEIGDPEVLAEGMERLGRLAYRVVWVNPLKGDPHYEPLARGMARALPYIDVFIPGHNFASLEEFAKLLPGLASRVRVAGGSVEKSLGSSPVPRGRQDALG